MKILNPAYIWRIAGAAHPRYVNGIQFGITKTLNIRHRASGTGWRVVPPGAAGLLTLLEFSAGTPAGPGKSLKQ